MNLLIAAMQHCDQQKVAALLKASGYTQKTLIPNGAGSLEREIVFGQERSLDPDKCGVDENCSHTVNLFEGDITEETLAAGLACDDDATLLLFFTTPERVLVSAIEGERSSNQALEAWRRAAKQFLAIHERQPDRTLLLNADAALSDPSRMAHQCKHVFDLDLVMPVEAGNPLTPVADPICQLIASEWLSQASDIKELESELLSRSVVGDHTSVPEQVDWLHVMETYRRRRDELCGGYGSLYPRDNGKLSVLDEGSEFRPEQEHVSLSKYRELEKENDFLLTQLYQTQRAIEESMTTVSTEVSPKTLMRRVDGLVKLLLRPLLRRLPNAVVGPLRSARMWVHRHIEPSE